MFGCLSRLVSLAVLVILVGAGYLTRDWWLPRVRAAVLASPPPATARWAPVDDAAARAARGKVARLARRDGPAFTTLSAAEFAALAIGPVARVLGDSAAHAEASVDGDRLLVRAQVALADLGGPQALGPLTEVLRGRQPVLLAGRLEPVGRGLAQYRLDALEVKDIKVPSAAFSRIAARIGAAARTDSVARDAVPLPLPDGVADLRVGRGGVTLYRGAP